MNEWTFAEWQTQIKEQRMAMYYLYTPMCGTCQVASRMMDVVTKLVPDLPVGKANLNFVIEAAEAYEIESVPCLLIVKNGELEKKIYAFQSVPYLYSMIQMVDEMQES
ncbi:thioredoxin family protein [Planomicrobium sp. YIM 101495]|uniref:thioredoxin family protein n=1 Tax=Planomicrobium sp. YIM 101495 TaxID=2665160 RepID=UPI0012B6E308|nr:thioredoxin family protein [Planomicrobium sp. YIM 101495]MTD31774.1 thioredoxin [Planomicrobium sp. YIM 101495]